MSRLTTTTALLLALASGCAAPPREVPLFARARLATDFDTYAIRRVGLPAVRVPSERGDAYPHEGAFLQQAFATQVGLGTPYEVVPLSRDDLVEVPAMDPHRDGYHDRDALVALANRFALDGVLLVEVVEQQPYPPQRVTVRAELVACETGSTIWSADVSLDSRDPRVREGFEVYGARAFEEDEGHETWSVALLSPRSFAEFALWQLAQML